MKKANIYKITIKDTSAEGGVIELTCVAASISNAIKAVTPTKFNHDTLNYEYTDYDEKDVLNVTVVEADVIVQEII